jgi:hypothetical protein
VPNWASCCRLERLVDPGARGLALAGVALPPAVGVFVTDIAGLLTQEMMIDCSEHVDTTKSCYVGIYIKGLTSTV